MNTCKKCQQAKDLSEFYKNASTLDNYCKQCRKEYNQARTPTYTTWYNMKTRCTNRNHTKFKDYGGRGITMCDRWNKFENFLADMGQRPAGMTLDRINNNGNYEPNNCRWATWSQQMANRRGWKWSKTKTDNIDLWQVINNAIENYYSSGIAS